jgi:hypothetical protein
MSAMLNLISPRAGATIRLPLLHRRFADDLARFRNAIGNAMRRVLRALSDERLPYESPMSSAWTSQLSGWFDA